ncbi:MAG: cation transporter, partial [Chloroflexia bacterium]|nr:cation transporter [Chloroflexia bacterium]
MDKKRIHKIIKASWIAVFGNTFLAALKIIVGIISGSLAVLADGIDSASDIITSLITLITGRIISKPPNIKYPYGYSRADTIAAKFLSFVIFFAGAQLAITSIEKLFTKVNTEVPSAIALYVTFFSIIGKFLLARYLKARGEKLESLMLTANARNMQNDVLISVSVLTGLIFTIFFKLPILDGITALIVSAWIIKVSYEVFKQTNEELMEGNSDPEVYKRIFEAVAKVQHAFNPHRLRTRRLGNLLIVEMDIEVDANMTVKESHEIAMQVENEIKDSIPKVYDVLIHIEPLGNEEEERYGLNEGEINKLD